MTEETETLLNISNRIEEYDSKEITTKEFIKKVREHLHEYNHSIMGPCNMIRRAIGIVAYGMLNEEEDSIEPEQFMETLKSLSRELSNSYMLDYDRKRDGDKKQ